MLKLTPAMFHFFSKLLFYFNDFNIIFSATSGTFYIIEDVKVELDAKFNLEI